MMVILGAQGSTSFSPVLLIEGLADADLFSAGRSVHKEQA